MLKVLKSYVVSVEKINAHIQIVDAGDYTNEYRISVPKISDATAALLDNVKDDLLKEAKIGVEEIFDSAIVRRLMDEFASKAQALIERRIPLITPEIKNYLVGSLVHEMLGLGLIEILLADDNLEEIAINTSKEPVYIYHKEFGWLKTNIFVPTEQQIQNYASIIARRVGRQITTLDPLMDAHLVSGDRANATLFPVSTKGNTLDIRKFARKPWTITDFISNETISVDVASFFWLAMQYELNMLVAGGTSAGKTGMLNALMPFIQPNHRIISIEDTRELALPNFLHWVPLNTRLPNPEGKGAITMLDLMVNSLRMRPDRIVVGEIRRAEQAEVLFEAMHTGHSVYATMHADTADQVLRRITNPPINIPPVLLDALHLVSVVYRDRRKGIRRIYEVVELVSKESKNTITVKTNTLFRAKPNGAIMHINPAHRVFEALNMHTGMSPHDIAHDLEEKKKVLNWIVKNHVNTVNEVGRVISEYYSNPEAVVNAAEKGKKPEDVIRSK